MFQAWKDLNHEEMLSCKWDVFLFQQCLMRSYQGKDFLKRKEDAALPVTVLYQQLKHLWDMVLLGFCLFHAIHVMAIRNQAEVCFLFPPLNLLRANKNQGFRINFSLQEAPFGVWDDTDPRGAIKPFWPPLASPQAPARKMPEISCSMEAIGDSECMRHIREIN